MALCLAGCLAGSWPGACAPRAPRGLDSPLPQQRMEAAVRAAERQDTSAVPGIVPLLESDDPAVRMVAVQSLERITGQTLGYDHSADEPERRAAVERWVRWVSERYAPSVLDVSGGISGESP